MKKILALILIMGMLSLGVYLSGCSPKKDVNMYDETNGITSFEECVAAGGKVTRSIPAQCAIDKMSFTEEIVVTKPDSTEKTETDKKKVCESNEGNWIESSKECEGISKELCETNGGRFNECASACRNDPNAMVCTMQCVLVCEFAPKEETIETFMVGPGLKDCTGVAPQKCMVVNGEYFYSQIEGFTFEEGYEYELLVSKTERENVPMDASKYIYTLVEIVSKESANANTISSLGNTHACTEAEIGNMACTREFNPVCGNDGQEYSNPCTACGSGNIESWTLGKC